MITQATIKSIQDVMRKDVGIDGDAQRLGQMVWMFFLKVLDDRETESELFEDAFVSAIPEELRWRAWAAPDEGQTGDALLRFVNNDLFDGLKKLKLRQGANPEMTKVVRGLFSDAHNYMKSGTLLRQVINLLNRDLDFNTNEDRHVFGDIYESLLKGLQSAGDAGEYYTPRPVTEFMVELLDPKLTETVLDPAAGTGGFLLCALNHKRDRYVDSVDDDLIVQDSIRGVEKKPLPHLLCVTNMLLHGIDVPKNIRHGNTLARPLRDYGAADRVDIVVTNPPFQGMEEDGIEKNFPAGLRTRETADLFLALTLHILKQQGRAAIVLPDSSLFGDGVKQHLRERLLNEANLHTIVRLPHGVFSPYTDIKTNILFFDRGRPTEDIWFYELQPPTGEKFTKTKPIVAADFDQVREWWANREVSSFAWKVERSQLDAETANLNVRNPAEADLSAAFVRALETRTLAQSGLAALRGSIEGVLAEAPGPVGEHTRELIDYLADLAGQTPLTAGVVEDARVALTGLALRGELSVPAVDDRTIAETLAGYTPSESRIVRSTTPPPFDVPAHWKWVRLVEITDFFVGRTPPTQNHQLWSDNLDTGLPWTTITDMPRRGMVESTGRLITASAVDESFGGRAPVPVDTLLMGFKLSLGKTAITAIETFHNEAIASFQIEDDVLKRYLLWAIPYLARFAGSNPAVRGSTLNAKSVGAMWVPVPPAEEQERIVRSLRWGVEVIEDIAYRGEEVRGASGHVMKLLTARTDSL
ncbi:N-6 DNA methylase [Microbacterium foliorum]|uniref:N-6 DNA methylase n=1 Tax=Microbacterium foliorum TaxID=104336 RepID=UPI0028D85F3F|nr:N-6 DNA methylase [Microbacterium foliorum]